MIRLRVLAPLLVLAAFALPPTAAATPVEAYCIDALPWSYLCSGDVEGFVDYYAGRYVDAIAPGFPPEACLTTPGCFSPFRCLHEVDAFCPQPTSGPTCIEHPWGSLCELNTRDVIEYAQSLLPSDSTCELQPSVCVVDCPADPRQDRACELRVTPILALP